MAGQGSLMDLAGAWFTTETMDGGCMCSVKVSWESPNPMERSLAAQPIAMDFRLTAIRFYVLCQSVTQSIQQARTASTHLAWAAIFWVRSGPYQTPSSVLYATLYLH